ncbi:MAG TPA: hypothetical protein PLH33_05795, partial [Chitinophagaceae bacterium]|nr:hypothetical protein [Chitinophagaceae bacterium]
MLLTLYNLAAALSQNFKSLTCVQVKLSCLIAFFHASAVLSNEINDIEKVARYIDKAKQMGMKILPPDINVSLDTFT